MQSPKSLRSKEAENVSSLLKKSLTLRELIDLSQESRANPKSLPDSLFGKIKVKPISNKRPRVHQEDLILDQCQKLNGRNYIVPPINQKSSGSGESCKSFKEKLTDFIM